MMGGAQRPGEQLPRAACLDADIMRGQAWSARPSSTALTGTGR